MADHFDIIVLGGGPGGYAAAGRGAQLGFSTALVERDRLGGICLNWGCIPTKALLDSAHAWQVLKQAKRYGLNCDNPSADFSAVIARSRAVADRMSKGVAFLMKTRKVTVISGEGRLSSPSTITVTSEGDVRELTADHIILATGGRPVCLPGMTFDGTRIIHSTHAMTRTTLPESMIIVGGGAIGMEFADIYRAFGTDVTVVEMMPSVLPLEDEEIVKELNRTLRRKKIKTLVKTRVESVSLTDSGVSMTVTTPKGETILKADQVLLAVGVQPNSQGIGLEEAGVDLDRGFVRIDERCRTNVPGVYAVGDLAGPPLLAHKASMEGVVCVNGIAGHEPFVPVDYTTIPGCTYCHPQVASVGFTENAAVDAGYTVKKGMFPFRANGRAIAMDEPDGLVKLVFNAADDILLGAHIIHAHASELLAQAGTVLTMKGSARDIADTIHAHPTLSESVMEAAAAALGEAVHI